MVLLRVSGSGECGGARTCGTLAQVLVLVTRATAMPKMPFLTLALRIQRPVDPCPHPPIPPSPLGNHVDVFQTTEGKVTAPFRHPVELDSVATRLFSATGFGSNQPIGTHFSTYYGSPFVVDIRLR